MFAIVIFSLVAVSSISIMNSGLATASSTLEITMARSEIDAQSQALRFIANNYFAERNLQSSSQQYRTLWRAIASIAQYNEDGAHTLSEFNLDSCEQAYDWAGNRSLFRDSAFILNTRDLSSETDTGEIDSAVVVFTRQHGTSFSDDLPDANRSDKFYPASLYPRIIYGNSLAAGDSESGGSLVENRPDYTEVARAEGIWVVATTKKIKNQLGQDRYEYYDFHIRTCWNTPGSKVPKTIGTIVRIYNPDMTDKQESISEYEY
jgi:hypothetical protein